MNTSDSLDTESKNLLNLISNNWDELDDSLKSKLTRIWSVLTYKWQLQILFNLPFLIYWILDKNVESILIFNRSVINQLNLPDWIISFIGFTN